MRERAVGHTVVPVRSHAAGNQRRRTRQPWRGSGWRSWAFGPAAGSSSESTGNWTGCDARLERSQVKMTGRKPGKRIRRGRGCVTAHRKDGKHEEKRDLQSISPTNAEGDVSRWAGCTRTGYTHGTSGESARRVVRRGHDGRGWGHHSSLRIAYPVRDQRNAECDVGVRT